MRRDENMSMGKAGSGFNPITLDTLLNSTGQFPAECAVSLSTAWFLNMALQLASRTRHNKQLNQVLTWLSVRAAGVDLCHRQAETKRGLPANCHSRQQPIWQQQS